MSSRTRYFRSYRPYSSGGRRARNQQRAADQQRDSTTIVISANYAFDCGQNMYQVDKINNKWYDTGCAAINLYDILRKSDYFNQFSELYDQFKLDNAKAKIIATNWATSKEESGTEKINEILKSRSYIIVTAWDRTGLSANQIVKNPEWQANPNIQEPDKRVFYCTIGKSITDYGSAKTKHLGPGNAYEIVRQIYPENSYEKSQFISTKLLSLQQVRSSNNGFEYNCYYRRLMPTDEDPNNTELVAMNFDERSPCNLLSNPACPYKPTLLVNVIGGPNPAVVKVNETDEQGYVIVNEIGVNKIKPVTFDIEFELVVTFRGLRYNRNIEYVAPERDLSKEKTYQGNGIEEDIDCIIKKIKTTETRFGNDRIIPMPYNFASYETFAPINIPKKTRYVVYLNRDDNSNRYGIHLVNCGSGRYTINLGVNEMFLLDYIDDEAVIEDDVVHGNNYINITFYADKEGPNNTELLNQVVFGKSYENNVPPPDKATNNNPNDQIIGTFPTKYAFFHTDDMEEETNP